MRKFLLELLIVILAMLFVIMILLSAVFGNIMVVIAIASIIADIPLLYHYLIKY